MGIRIDNAAPAPWLRILDVYSGFFPYVSPDWEIRDVITQEMKGLCIGSWPNANLFIELIPESPTRTGRLLFRPRPGDILKFPEATYRVRVFLNPDALAGVEAGFVPAPSPAVLSLISGGWHELMPVTGEEVSIKSTFNPNQSIAVLRVRTLPAGSTASNTVQHQGGNVYQYIDADAAGSLHVVLSGPVVLDSFTSTAPAQPRAAGEENNPGFITCTARNTTGASRDIHVDLVVVR